VKRFRAGVYLPTLITLWSLVCTFMGFTKSFAGLVVCRLLLGLFEGGILGGVIIYLAFFYLRGQMLLRSGLSYCAAPLSGAFGGLLASGLSRIEIGDYRRWPWIFFSELSTLDTETCALICLYSRAQLPSSSASYASSPCPTPQQQRAS
jgi:MFS family permease